MRSLQGFLCMKMEQNSPLGLERQQPRKPTKTPRATPHPSEIPTTNADPLREARPARLPVPSKRGILDSTELA